MPSVHPCKVVCPLVLLAMFLGLAKAWNGRFRGVGAPFRIIRNAQLLRSLSTKTSNVGHEDNYPAAVHKPNDLNTALLSYLRGNLVSAVVQRQNHTGASVITTHGEELAEQIYNNLINDPKYNSCNRLLAESGSMLCRAILCASDESWQKGTVDLSSIISEYRDIVDSNKQVFQTIQRHHHSIGTVDWANVTASTDALAKYSEAAARMGSKKWVVQGNEWMEDFAVSYFRLGGARRHYLDKTVGLPKMQFASVEEKRVFVDQFTKDLTSTTSDDGTAWQRKIRLLDVGSCYNPIAKSKSGDAFTVTAVDLYPADPTVYQCDFLNVGIGEPNSAPVFEMNRTESTGTKHAPPGQSITHLPAASFDAVTMSLVLSYLPTPAQRVAMIRKARQLLTSPDRTPASAAPHHTGLLLIVEKESIFSKEHTQDSVGKNKSHLLTSWKQAIANEGFELVKYRVLKCGSHLSHAFAFATKPLPAGGSDTEPTATQGLQEPPQMWIKQDFDPVPAQHVGMVSDSDREEPVLDAKPRIGADLVKRPIGIVGGGIGGCALALSLQQKKIPFVVFEKDSGFDVRKQGYALTMQQGGQALRALGLGDLLGDHGAISVKHVSYRADGIRLGAYGLTKRRPAEGDAGPSMASTASPPITEPTTVLSAEEELLKAKTRHNVHIPRQRLREIMLQSVNTSSVLWGKKLAALQVVTADLNMVEADDHIAAAKELTPPFVRATFEDGTSYELSAVVGADGIFSSVRQQLLQSATVLGVSAKDANTSPADGLKYLGLMVILGISPNHLAEPDTPAGAVRAQRQWLDGATRVFTMPYDKHHTMWQLSYPCDEVDALRLAATYQPPPSIGLGERESSMLSGADTVLNPLLEDALRRCEGWAPELLNILKASDPRLVSGHPVYDRDPDSLNLIDRITKGTDRADQAPAPVSIPESTQSPSAGNAQEAPPVRDWPVTLLGDAAHPMSPFKGQGANQAILDALALSRAISTSNLCGSAHPPGGGNKHRGHARRSLAECLRSYEAEMYAKGAEKVRRSRDAAYYLHSQAALAEGNVTRAKAAEDYALSVKSA